MNLPVTQSLQKWGNGTGVRLPKAVLDAAHIQVGQKFTVSLNKGSIILKPQKAVRPTLAALLSGATPHMVGGEYAWGDDKGKERL